MTIEIHSSGYGHSWVLIAFSKRFYLGQDVKVCSRLLGMSPRDLISAAGCSHPCDLRVESNSKKIARYICRHVGLTKTTANKLESWALAVD